MRCMPPIASWAQVGVLMTGVAFACAGNSQCGIALVTPSNHQLPVLAKQRLLQTIFSIFLLWKITRGHIRQNKLALPNWGRARAKGFRFFIFADEAHNRLCLCVAVQVWLPWWLHC
jgi:hypothetical protein